MTQFIKMNITVFQFLSIKMTQFIKIYDMV